MTYLTIERAARYAWPAIEEKRLPYGILRFAHGYTKRSNSMLVTRGNLAPHGELLENCDEFFGRHGQPVIIRIPSFTTAVRLDQFLAGSGFEVVQRSQVMSVALGQQHTSVVRPIELDRDAWLEACYEISGEPLANRAIHARLLERIPGETLFACLEDETGAPACCGMAVLCLNVVGFFNIVTAVSLRRRGLATLLVGALLAWARTRRATHAFLQVERANEEAVSVYEKLGFTSLYSYWYRIRRSDPDITIGEGPHGHH